MAPDFHSYDPAGPHGIAFDPLKAIVAPRPIGWISTVNASGQHNLAPYSLFNVLNTRPPIVGFSSDGHKDSLRNALSSGCFTCNVVTADLQEVMNASSFAAPAEVSEPERLKIAMLPGTAVASPRLTDSPASLECRTIEVRDILDMHGNPSGSLLVTGQVVQIHINRAYLSDGRFDLTKVRPVTRLGYRDYAIIDRLYEMPPPSAI